MLKAVTLSAPQLSTLAPLVTAQANAAAAYETATMAVQAALSTIAVGAGITSPRARLYLSDDGNTLIAE